ncbi:hypothetical protein P3T24_006592 [Paraburkholderia sp. GAS33]
MLLKNDLEGRKLLDETVRSYYRKTGDRSIKHFLWSDDRGSLASHFLLERQHVLKISVGEDRGAYLTSIQLGIGPHYFGPADFWSYEDYKRFKFEADTLSVTINLQLMDEFLGYSQYLPRYD